VRAEQGGFVVPWEVMKRSVSSLLIVEIKLVRASMQRCLVLKSLDFPRPEVTVEENC
jgi:hypothetical protein